MTAATRLVLSVITFYGGFNRPRRPARTCQILLGMPLYIYTYTYTYAILIVLVNRLRQRVVNKLFKIRFVPYIYIYRLILMLDPG